MREDAAAQVLLELADDVAGQPALVGVARVLEELGEVLADEAVEDRALGAPRLVALGQRPVRSQAGGGPCWSAS
jgi:hypothetical protein